LRTSAPFPAAKDVTFAACLGAFADIGSVSAGYAPRAKDVAFAGRVHTTNCVKPESRAMGGGAGSIMGYG